MVGKKYSEKKLNELVKAGIKATLDKRTKEIFKDIEGMPEAYWVVVKDYIVSVRKKYIGR